MSPLPEFIDGLPNLSGAEALLRAAAPAWPPQPTSNASFAQVRSVCAIALHMHQPLLPAGGNDLRTAAIIGNLQYMLEHPGEGDNHNAPVFRQCYQRMGTLIPQLLEEGHQPRVMLDYSGTLLYGLRQMGAHEVLASLQTLTNDPRYRHAVEWLGTAWGHPVAPSTPPQDFGLHVRAWQQHFAALFGLEALRRVSGFSPPEMALPNHPDVAYAFVKTLKACGYQWVLVQEHTVEQPANGRSPDRPHLPHRLVCTNSHGETASILAILKTQGSDTKLVGQMQPYFEARSLTRWELAGKSVPPLVTQIADGENGGVMMNEFPPKYLEVVRAATGTDVPLMNVTEYLAQLFALGVQENDFPVVQPRLQQRLWERCRPGAGPVQLAQAIKTLREEDHRFHMDGGSWTNNLSWVLGYETVLGEMEQVSALFAQRATQAGVAPTTRPYRNALFHLLVSQTSCYRYWGPGRWTDYGRELCRRASDILQHDFAVPSRPNSRRA